MVQLHKYTEFHCADDGNSTTYNMLVHHLDLNVLTNNVVHLL